MAARRFPWFYRYATILESVAERLGKPLRSDRPWSSGEPSFGSRKEYHRCLGKPRFPRGTWVEARYAAVMDVRQILAQLIEERDQVDEAILSLERLAAGQGKRRCHFLNYLA